MLIMNNSMSGSQWEDLRRQARSLEHEIDNKLVSFSKMGSSFASREQTQSQFGTTTPYPNSSEHLLFPTMALEIEQLLDKLSRTNDMMSESLQSLGPSAATGSYHHTLQRHREILQDYSQEFHRTRNNINAMKERDDLLGSVHREIFNYKNASNSPEGSGPNNSRTSILLTEHQRISNSERLLDDQLSVAADMKKSLGFQRSVLRGAQSRLLAMASRFPVVNSLIHKINFRRRRDTIIVGSVIACCFIVILLYLFR